MSSNEVRQAIISAVTTAASPLPVFDLSDYISIEEILETQNEQVVIIQFVVSDEQMQSIGGEGNQGWEETGTVIIHLIVPTGFDSEPVVIVGDAIRKAIRGKRLTASIIVESMVPFVDFSSGSIGVEGAMHGYASSLYYVRRDCG